MCVCKLKFQHTQRLFTMNNTAVKLETFKSLASIYSTYIIYTPLSRAYIIQWSSAVLVFECAQFDALSNVLFVGPGESFVFGRTFGISARHHSERHAQRLPFENLIHDGLCTVGLFADHRRWHASERRRGLHRY